MRMQLIDTALSGCPLDQEQLQATLTSCIGECDFEVEVTSHGVSTYVDDVLYISHYPACGGGYMVSLEGQLKGIELTESATHVRDHLRQLPPGPISLPFAVEFDVAESNLTVTLTEPACTPRTDQNAEDANAVFFATVTRESNNNAFLDVTRVWKGEVPKETWTWTSALSTAVDADASIVGNSYLLYGEPNGSVDGFFAFPCATQQMTLADATTLLGTGGEPRDFVATFDEPFPTIDGSPLGITTNGYVVSAFFAVLTVGILIGIFGSTILRRFKK